ncbi:MAG: hypothetical protein V4591_10060 [Bdellovibrionota bacterium]
MKMTQFKGFVLASLVLGLATVGCGKSNKDDDSQPAGGVSNNFLHKFESLDGTIAIKISKANPYSVMIVNNWSICGSDAFNLSSKSIGNNQEEVVGTASFGASSTYTFDASYDATNNTLTVNQENWCHTPAGTVFKVASN